MNEFTDFDEDRSEFKGFNKFYTGQILPYLQEREYDRLARIGKGKKVGGVIVGVGMILAIHFFYRFDNMIVPGLTAFFSLLIGGVTAFSMMSKLKGEVKQFLMDAICGFVGWTYTYKPELEPDMKIWQSNKLLPRYDRMSFEDQMSGNAHGADFVFCETHLETQHRDKDGHTKWRTAFRGIMLEIDFHREFLGRTVVLRDAGIFNFKKKAGMKRVGLVDPKFEKIFEAYSTDQVESRYLLTTTFMQKLVDLETVVKGKKIRFGFLEGKLHIAVQAPNQFEAGSMMKPLTDPERTQKILDEIGSIFDIIDGVIRPEPNRHV